MASIHVKLTLDLRYKCKDGYRRIVLSLRRRDERAWIALSTKIILDPLWWDAKAQTILPQAKLPQSVSSLNTYLRGQLSDLERRLLRLEDNGDLKGLSLSLIAKRLQDKPSSLSIGELNDAVVKELKKHH